GVTFSSLGGVGSTNATRSTLIFEFFNNVGVQNAQTAGGYGLDSSGTATVGVLGMPTSNFATGGTITVGITFNAANTNAVTGGSFWGELIQEKEETRMAREFKRNPWEHTNEYIDRTYPSGVAGARPKL